MKKIALFLRKYRYRILFFCFLLLMSQVVIPGQLQTYTRASISAFKSDYLLPAILVVFSGVFLYQCAALWLKYRHHVAIIRHRWIRIVLGGFLPKAITFTMLFFCIQDVFIASALFINRLSTHGGTERTYVVQFLMDSTRAKESLFLSDIASKELSHDKVLQDYVYNTQLKDFDTVHIIYRTGILGVPLPDVNHTKK
ncbi:hypothetical protein [Chitinophaga pinensis]|uniref:Uncharacterized protein n=1 Tax=Chitinophaga pinensis TaxID=79329 RepID=A0A5C6LL77_9BACT|nr:hypothetical protein [Chitinophaga pinensis]TWV94010.1 hypothetical protein FEF09_26095 [Chitinophaga pinensis]